MQGTAEFHDQIADTFFPQAEAVFDDATTLYKLSPGTRR
jgi:hypothetical protein